MRSLRYILLGVICVLSACTHVTTVQLQPAPNTCQTIHDFGPVYTVCWDAQGNPIGGGAPPPPR